MSCSDSAGTTPISGTFDLQSFAGGPLPGTIPTGGGGSMTVFSGEITLTADRRFVLSVERRFCPVPDPCQDESITEEGSYSLDGILLALIMDGGGSLGGRYHDDWLSLDDSNPPSVWVRRD